VIQPHDDNDGVDQLLKNKDACQLQFQVVDHVLTSNEGEKIRGMVDQDFDCLVVDCENCLGDEYRKNPNLFKHVQNTSRAG
jgi:hypothetical protein